MPLDKPVFFVAFPEFEQRLLEFGDGLEGPERSRFSFSVRMNHSPQPLPSGARMKGGGGCNAKPAGLAVEIVRHIPASVIIAQAETGGPLLADCLTCH